MPRDPAPVVTRPASPFDHDIFLLQYKLEQGGWSDCDMLRAATIVDLYFRSETPGANSASIEEADQMLSLWCAHLNAFRDLVYETAATGPLGAAAKLRLLQDEMREDLEDEKAALTTVITYLEAEGRKGFDPPTNPYNVQADELLLSFVSWDDAALKRAVDLALELKCWIRSTECSIGDEIFEHLSLRGDLLGGAIRVAPVTGPVGAKAKMHFLAQSDPDEWSDAEEEDMLATITAGLTASLERAIEPMRQAA